MPENLEKIRPIYYELQGFLKQAPSTDRFETDDQTLWETLHSTIDELNSVTGIDYSKYKVNIEPSIYGQHKLEMKVSDYRNKLSGLIMRLYGEYFFKDSTPFENGPNMVVNQTNQQTVQISMVLEIQSLIDKQLNNNSDLKSEEKNFLEKIKSSLVNIKSVSDLINLILVTGTSLGLSLAQVAQLFNK